MKRNVIAISIIFLIGIGFIICLSLGSSDDEINTDSTNQNNAETQVGTVKALAVDYTLTDGSKSLKIHIGEDIYIKNTDFSIPENVYIAFSNSDFEMFELPLGYMMVVPSDYVRTQADELTLDSKYKDSLQEFMAFNSSTQCSILKTEDFTKKDISGYTVWVAEREDYCTFGLETPVTQVINMYGFETNGYTIILSINGDLDEIDGSPNELIETVISLTTIE